MSSFTERFSHLFNSKLLSLQNGSEGERSRLSTHDLAAIELERCGKLEARAAVRRRQRRESTGSSDVAIGSELQAVGCAAVHVDL